MEWSDGSPQQRQPASQMLGKELRGLQSRLTVRSPRATALLLKKRQEKDCKSQGKRSAEEHRLTTARPALPGTRDDSRYDTLAVLGDLTQERQTPKWTIRNLLDFNRASQAAQKGPCST